MVEPGDAVGFRPDGIAINALAVTSGNSRRESA
jgi:hypothetical protein